MSSPRRGTPAQPVFPGRAAGGGEESSEAADQSAAGEDVTSAISLRVTPNELGVTLGPVQRSRGECECLGDARKKGVTPIGRL